MTIKTKQLNLIKNPNLRFPEFSDEWKEKKLHEIANFWNGKAHEQDISTNGKYIVINSKFVSTNGKVKKYSNKQISPLKKGDIVIVMSDVPNGKAIGKCFSVDKNEIYTLNQRIGGIKSRIIISPFLFRILNRNKYFLKFNNGVSQTNLRKAEVLKCPIIFPSQPEQQKIADFLELVDEWIINLNLKKETLKIYKRSIMQKIFNQEISFKNTNKNNFPKWKIHKLSDLYDFGATNSLSRDKLNYENGNVYNIHYGDIHTKFSSHFQLSNENVPLIKNSINNFTLKHENLIEEGDIIIADASEDYNDIGKTIEIISTNKKMIISGLHTILCKKKTNFIAKGFIGHLMKSTLIKLKIKKIAQGIKVLGLPKKYLKDLNIILPSLPEQKKITNFLSYIDNLIEEKQDQVANAEQWKKGLIQQLFI